MTAGQLKKILANIPDDVEVVKFNGGDDYAVSVYEAIEFTVRTRSDNPRVHHLSKKGGKKVFLIN